MKIITDENNIPHEIFEEIFKDKYVVKHVTNLSVTPQDIEEQISLFYEDLDNDDEERKYYINLIKQFKKQFKNIGLGDVLYYTLTGYVDGFKLVTRYDYNNVIEDLDEYVDLHKDIAILKQLEKRKKEKEYNKKILIIDETIPKLMADIEFKPSLLVNQRKVFVREKYPDFYNLFEQNSLEQANRSMIFERILREKLKIDKNLSESEVVEKELKATAKKSITSTLNCIEKNRKMSSDIFEKLD